MKHMNLTACGFQASEVTGTLSKQKQNSCISVARASGKSPLTFKRVPQRLVWHAHVWLWGRCEQQMTSKTLFSAL